MSCTGIYGRRTTGTNRERRNPHLDLPERRTRKPMDPLLSEASSLDSACPYFALQATKDTIYDNNRLTGKRPTANSKPEKERCSVRLTNSVHATSSRRPFKGGRVKGGLTGSQDTHDTHDTLWYPGLYVCPSNFRVDLTNTTIRRTTISQKEPY